MIKNQTLQQACEACGLRVPFKYRKCKNEIVSDIVFLTSIGDIPKGSMVLTELSEEELDDERLRTVCENAAFVVARKSYSTIRTIKSRNPWDAGVRAYSPFRRNSDAVVVGVTGSVGKTTTKEILESVLRRKSGDRLTASAGNSNTIRKISEMLEGLKGDEEIILQEAGLASMPPGKTADKSECMIGKSAALLNADVAVITNIKDSHIETTGSREKTAKYKLKLSDLGKPDGLAVYNFDDPLLNSHKYHQNTVSYSLNNSEADCYAKDIAIRSEGMSFTIVDKKRGREIPAVIGAFGEQFVLDSLPAYIVGSYLGMSDEEILEGFNAFETKGLRNNIFGSGTYTVLADCYNSSYDALSMIMKTLGSIEMENRGRNVAVIGDILELGDISEEIHRKCGKLLAGSGLDLVIFCGEQAGYSYDEYIKYRDNAAYCPSRDDLVEFIKERLEPNDFILFKASHGMDFGEAIDMLFGTSVGERSMINHKEYIRVEDEQFEYNLFRYHATVRSVKEVSGSEQNSAEEPGGSEQKLSETDGSEQNSAEEPGGSEQKLSETVGSEQNSAEEDKVSKLVIPAEMNGLPVTRMSLGLFRGNKQIGKVCLPETLVQISQNCFRESTVSEIVFGGNLKNIGHHAFARCLMLEKVTLPEGVLNIRRYAFSGDKSLKEIYIPESVTRIGENAFRGCEGMTVYCKKGSFADEYAGANGIAVSYDI